jgi:hypothetical protein
MKLDHTAKMDILGRMGEKVVSNYFAKRGVMVEQAVNHFDHTKDLTADGKTIEVKTQVPFILEKAFTFKENQLTKCRNVDELYFVAIPAPRHHFEHEGWLFRVDPKKFKTRTRMTKDGRKMVLIDIYQEAVKPVEKMADEVIKDMMKYTVSDY